MVIRRIQSTSQHCVKPRIIINVDSWCWRTQWYTSNKFNNYNVYSTLKYLEFLLTLSHLFIQHPYEVARAYSPISEETMAWRADVTEHAVQLYIEELYEIQVFGIYLMLCTYYYVVFMLYPCTSAKNTE